MTRRFDFAPLPPLLESSKNWISHLFSTAHDLAQHSKMSLHEALNLPVSFEAFYYSSEAWEKRKLEIEAEVKQSNVYIKMGNEVIKAISSLGGKRK